MIGEVLDLAVEAVEAIVSEGAEADQRLWEKTGYPETGK